MSDTIVCAIARQEGFYAAGSRPQRNNNPGDLEFGAFAQRNGATGGDPRFAIFSTPEDGFEALRNLLLYNYEGLTIAQAIDRFAPASENDCARYILNVCTWTGLTANTVLTAENIG